MREPLTPSAGNGQSFGAIAAGEVPTSAAATGPSEAGAEGMAPAGPATSSRGSSTPSSCGVRGYKHPHPAAAIGVLLGMAALCAVAFTDRGTSGALEALRLYDVAYFIFRTQTVLQIVWWMAVVAHVGEAAYAWHLATNELKLPASTAAAWAVSAALYGFFSLGEVKRMVAARRRMVQ